MTGFGKAVLESENKKVTVEIRSLNSKQLDLNLRMPNQFREKELELRSQLGKSLERGKVDISVYLETETEKGAGTINPSLAQTYHKQLKELAKQLNESGENLLPLVLKMPDVLKPERAEIDEDEWKLIISGIDSAIIQFNKFRDDEGNVLENEFRTRITMIADLLKQIETFDISRAPAVKDRIRKNLEENIAKDKIDQNRFEQELIYYLEKIDITEEKLRLKTHLDYFLKTADEDAAGRKLGFITQEIGREINTIGSKANDAEMQRIVVQMKDELEKIKEQLLNVL